MLKGAVLYVKELDRLTQFYLAIGGLQTDGNEGEYAVISSSETDLILLQMPKDLASKIVIEDPPSVRSATPLKPILKTLSIKDVLLTLSKMGGRCVPGAKPWKFRQYIIQDIVDPEGNVVQLWQPEYLPQSDRL